MSCSSRNETSIYHGHWKTAVINGMPAADTFTFRVDGTFVNSNESGQSTGVYEEVSPGKLLVSSGPNGLGYVFEYVKIDDGIQLIYNGGLVPHIIELYR